MFDHDALVFDNQITRAGIQLPDGTPYLELRCVGFPNFGIWSASQDGGAPFVCLEPWMGRCNDCGFTGDLSEKPFINHLKMDEMLKRHILLKYSKSCLKRAFCKMFVTICENDFSNRL